MRKHSHLTAFELLEIARRNTTDSALLEEAAAELRVRRSAAARNALAQVESMSAVNSIADASKIEERHDDLASAKQSLQRLWNVSIPDPVPAFELSLRLSLAGWSIAFTTTFKKAIEVVDKKLQGRVMVALSEIVDQPTTTRGDTIEPLSANFSGLWRYRIGDYRLIYEPRSCERLVVLVDFAPRGAAYTDA